MWTTNSEAVNDDSNVWESFMWWICLRNVLRDVKLMIHHTLISEITVIDFHSYITVGLPLLPRSTLKRLHKKGFKHTVVYLWSAILLNNCHIQASLSFHTCCEKCHQDSLSRNVRNHSWRLALPWWGYQMGEWQIELMSQQEAEFQERWEHTSH